MSNSKPESRRNTNPFGIEQIESSKRVFPRTLAELRGRKGLSQSDLHDEIGISVNSLSLYERGKLPSSENLIRLSTFFGVSADYLLGLEGEAPSSAQTEPTASDSTKGDGGKHDCCISSDVITLGTLARQLIGQEAGLLVATDDGLGYKKEGEKPKLNTDRLRTFLDQYYKYQQALCSDSGVVKDMYDAWLKLELAALDGIPLKQ